MASENTAIHDLLAGLQRKPVDQDPDDDVLFAGSRREDAGPRRVPRGTQPPPDLFAMPPPPPIAAPRPSPHLAVSLPRPFVHQPAVGVDRHISTSRVTRTNKKLYFVPAGLAIVAAVLVAILMGNKDDKAVKVAASGAAATEKPAAMIALEAAAAARVATPPSVTPITEPAAAPSVTPITEPAALPNDAVAPAEVVPASAFVAAQGTTVPTVPTVPAAAVATTETEAPAAVAEAAPAPAKAKKSRRELAREKRSAKRASKRATKRAPKAVARAESTTSEKLNGNGALAVSSSQPREVWVDGRNSKRMTPLRVLLKPGKHKVTLFDKDHGTAKTFEVEIKPDATTKIAK
jgi:hypothetical protein